MKELIDYFYNLQATDYGHYLQGIPNQNEAGPIRIIPSKEGISIRYVNIFSPEKERVLINLKKEEILDFSVEDQSTIESKISLSRMLLVGVFALAWKKRKTNPMAFILIKYKDDVGLEQTITLSSTKKDSFQTYNNIKYNLYKLWKEYESYTDEEISLKLKNAETKFTEKTNSENNGCIIFFIIIIVIFLIYIMIT